MTRSSLDISDGHHKEGEAMRIRILASAIMAGLLCAAPHAGNANPPSTKANAQIATPAQAYDALLSNANK